MASLRSIVPCPWFDSQPAGKVMTVAFELDGQPFTALNGGPEAQHCGWLKDRFGPSWQVIPVSLLEMLDDPDPAKVKRVTEAMLRMKKLEVAALERAFAA